MILNNGILLLFHFFTLFLLDEELAQYHYIIKNVCTIINNDQERILKKIIIIHLIQYIQYLKKFLS